MHVDATQIKLIPEILNHLLFRSHIHIINFEIIFISKRIRIFIRKSYNKKKEDNCEDINNYFKYQKLYNKMLYNIP